MKLVPDRMYSLSAAKDASSINGGLLATPSAATGHDGETRSVIESAEGERSSHSAEKSLPALYILYNLL